MRLHFIPIHVFRETPSVTFFDAGVPGSNGTDVVAHHGSATSPPDQEGSEQYYVHRHQVDNNLVLEGSRTFTLLNPAWDHPHHIIHLIRAMEQANSFKIQIELEGGLMLTHGSILPNTTLTAHKGTSST